MGDEAQVVKPNLRRLNYWPIYAPSPERDFDAFVSHCVCLPAGRYSPAWLVSRAPETGTNLLSVMKELEVVIEDSGAHH